MERRTFKILFFIKKTRVSRNGEVPVLLRVTVDGLRTETSINLKVNPELWHASTGRVSGTDRKSEELNNTLDTIKLKIMKIYREMEFDGIRITAKGIIEKYLGKDKKSQMTLLKVFKEHNERCAQLAGKDMSPATVERYETSFRHTQEFIRECFN